MVVVLGIISNLDIHSDHFICHHRCCRHHRLAKREVTDVLKKIKICGIPYKIRQVNVIDEEFEGVTQGLIVYSNAEIKIKKNLPRKLKKSVLYHEIVHGILTQMGYNDLSNDEKFVQSLSIAIYQMFDLKEEKNAVRRKEGKSPKSRRRCKA